MNKSRHRAHVLPVIGLLAADGLFFGLTDPDKVPSFFLMVGFLLCAGTLYVLIRALLAASSWYGLPFNRHGSRLARVITVTAGALIALQSIGELGSRDILVLMPLTLISYLYVSYGRTTPRVAQRE
jgi:hypothetical protein